MSRLKDKSIIEVDQIGDHIVHISMDDKNELASTVMRFQEYYESPFDDIRGQIFTLGFLKSKGSRSNPKLNTYGGNSLLEADWDGYNFPGSVLEPFIKGLFDPLTPSESALVEMLRYRTDEFYVIATYGDQAELNTLEHEIRHAMYGISKEYRDEVDNAMAPFFDQLEPLSRCLTDWGYHSDVLEDEFHAYMGSDHDYFFKTFTDDVSKYEIPQVPELRDKLNRIAKKYKPKLGID